MAKYINELSFAINICSIDCMSNDIANKRIDQLSSITKLNYFQPSSYNLEFWKYETALI